MKIDKQQGLFPTIFTTLMKQDYQFVNFSMIIFITSENQHKIIKLKIRLGEFKVYKTQQFFKILSIALKITIQESKSQFIDIGRRNQSGE